MFAQTQPVDCEHIAEALPCRWRAGFVRAAEEHRREFWIADHGMLEVSFDADGRVVWSDVRNVVDTRPPWFTQLIRRFTP